MSQLSQSINNAVKHWYLPLITGILFIAFGVYIFTVPLAAYVTLTVFFTVSFIVTGLLEIIFALQNTKTQHGWGWYLTGGLFTLATGFILAVYPAISISLLPFVVGFTLLFRSFQALGYAFDLKRLLVLNWGGLALLSVLGILFALLLLANPVFTALSLVAITGLSFIASGAASVILALRLKKL